MGKNMDLAPIGKRFGRWTVIKFVRKTEYRDRYYLCKCVCGNEGVINYKSMTRKLSTSCGCRRDEVTINRSTTHGASTRKHTTSEYRAWCHIRKRCYNKNDHAYKNYGGRGIKVCKRWLESFENFLEDMGLKPSPKLTIERKENDGDYCKENCKWATALEQSRNKRNNHRFTHNGESLLISEWAEKTGIKRSTLAMRIYNYKQPIGIALRP